jgi:hypothetical protein
VNTSKYACALCDGTLQTPNEVCKSCDTVLEQSPFFAVDSPTETHFYHAGGQCPACKETSKRFEISRYPKNARWYTPERELPFCAKCKTVLNNKHGANSQIFFLIFWVLYMGIVLIFSKESRHLWQSFVVGAALCIAVLMRYRAYRDPEKYVVVQKQA